MTETDIHAIGEMICDYVRTPRDKAEIVRHLVDMGVHPTVASNAVPWAAGKGLIAMAPGSKGNKWTTRSNARRIQDQDPQEAEE